MTREELRDLAAYNNGSDNSLIEELAVGLEETLKALDLAEKERDEALAHARRVCSLACDGLGITSTVIADDIHDAAKAAVEASSHLEDRRAHLEEIIQEHLPYWPEHEDPETSTFDAEYAVECAADDIRDWKRTVARLEKERDEARERTEKAEHRVRHQDELIADLNRAQYELSLAKAQLATVNAGVEDVWFWEGRGGDDAESLSCPVVMDPRTLRAFIERAERAERERTAAIQDLITICHRLGVVLDSDIAVGRKAYDALTEVVAKAATLDRLTAPGPALLSEEQLSTLATAVMRECGYTMIRPSSTHFAMLRAASREQLARAKALLEAVPVEELVGAMIGPDSQPLTRAKVAEAHRARLLAALTETTDPQAGGAPGADAGEKETER